jgi:hypothetical protein
MKWKRKSILILLTSLSFTILACRVNLDFDYAASRPREPRPAEGRTYGIWVHHGDHVYLTQREYWVMDQWQWPFLGFFFRAFFLNRRWHVFS